MNIFSSGFNNIDFGETVLYSLSLLKLSQDNLKTKKSLVRRNDFKTKTKFETPYLT